MLPMIIWCFTPDSNKPYRLRQFAKNSEYWMGLPFPEEIGGAGMTFLDLAILLTEMGYYCVPGPFFSMIELPVMLPLMSRSSARVGSSSTLKRWVPSPVVLNLEEMVD